jgi:DNA-binding beta-propeller fold protein YncE
MSFARKAVLPVLSVLLLAAALAQPADASRTLLSKTLLKTDYCKYCIPPSPPPPEPLPPPEGQLEDPCGLAVAPSGEIYVADYYHRVVDVFSPGGTYGFQIALPGGPITGLGSNELDGVCGLAIDSSGNLYANEWHEAVVRLAPTEFTLDDVESTGVAVDAAGDVFVDDRTYVAKYAAPVKAGDTPVAQIGLGTLGEGYGLAVSADGSRVYVADAAANAVKVYEPGVSLTAPQRTIDGGETPQQGFSSLTDAALAIDPTVEPALPEHLLVLDNLQPGYEQPEAAVDEFEAPGAGHPGAYAYVGQLKGPPGAPIVDGGPSGLAVDAAGNLLVTDGNGELGNVFKFGPYGGAGLIAAPGPATTEGATRLELGAAPGVGAAAVADGARHRSPGSASASEVSQSGGVRVSFHGSLAPRALPRHGSRPVVASVGARIRAVGGRTPPQLRRIEIAINRNGRFSPGTLPSCQMAEIQPATTAAALAACRDSLVGEGSFSARVLLPEQAPFPSTGRVYAFNGRWHGRPAILAHVYGTEPLPVSYTLPFELLSRRGTFGTVMRASLPTITGNSGYITGLSLTFGRGSRARGYVSASCPAPAGFRSAAFPFARVEFSFARGRKVGSTLVRSCEAKGGSG